MKKFLAALSLLASTQNVEAQWQVPTNDIPIGRGVGTGFNFLAPGASGNIITSNGTSFSSVAISGDCTIVAAGTITCTRLSGSAGAAGAIPISNGTVFQATSVIGDCNIAFGGTITCAGKANLASPAFTGVPTAPTATVDTNTTQLSTTGFVLGQAGTLLPLINGTATVGTSLRYSRQDHIHPTDTTRAPTASPTFTGTLTAAAAAFSGTVTFSGPVLFGSSTKTTSYITTSSDCGTTIFAGGTAFYPITVNAASGYTDNCQIKITNTDNTPGTWRAKRINITLPDGSTTRLLAPGQTIAYQKQGSANTWSVAIEPGRWLAISSPTFYINVSGSDNNDGLASDTGGAFATIYGALGAWKPLLDCGRGGPVFQIANFQTHVITASPQEAYAWVGGCNITIQGATGIDDRSTYIVQCTSGGTCLNFKENTVVVILNGMRLTCLTNCTGIFSQQGVILDINNMEFGGMGTGSMITCEVQSRCGIFRPVITSGAGNFVVCSIQSFCEFTGSHIYSTPPPAYGFTSANVFAQWSSVIMAGGAYAISGGAGVTGVRYQALWNSIINLGPGVADTLPGNAAGVTGGTPTHGTDSSMVF